MEPNLQVETESGSRARFICNTSQLHHQLDSQLHSFTNKNSQIIMFWVFTVDDPNSSLNSVRIGPELGLEFRWSWCQVGQTTQLSFSFFIFFLWSIHFGMRSCLCVY